MTIEGIVEIVSNTTPFLTSGDIIAIGVSIVSLIGVLGSTYFTNRTTSKISADNKEHLGEWNQKNIDASLTANARIEWIQKVRNTTSELIVAYFKLLKTENSKDQEKLLEELYNSQEKAELLILYFGPETETISSELEKGLLLNKESNEGKNDQIVDLIQELVNCFNKHYEDIRSNKFKVLKSFADELREQMYQNATKGELIERYDDDGEDQSFHIPEFRDEDSKEYQKARKILESAYQDLKEVEDKLIYLRNVMRIYLKIEWNRAKRGM
jgi:hypothetical protein